MQRKRYVGRETETKIEERMDTKAKDTPNLHIGFISGP